jgi:predicted dehydrogenase/nucleoside-diphosphate-sugar epimerase
MSNEASGKKLRVGIVGAGYVARYHIEALKRLDFVEVAAICDVDKTMAQTLAERYRIPFVTDDVSAFADQRLDAVHVLTPPSSHCAITLKALDMGCHVLVEKPMADTVDECDLMIARAKEKGRVLSVNHSDRFDPVIMQALDLVKSGKCGDVIAVDVLRSSEYPAYAGGPLPALVTQGSYPFRDLGVHGLYTLEAFLGPITSLDVSHRTTNTQPNLRFDEWNATANCERGLGRLLLSWNVRPMEARVIVHGTRAVVEADRFLQICRVLKVTPGPKFIGLVAGTFFNALKDVFRVPWNVVRFATGSLKPSPGIQRCAAEFARSLHEGTPPPVSAEEGRHVVALMESICAVPDRERIAELEARYQPLAPVDALVTGAAGFLGKRVVAALRERGQTVRVLVRRPADTWKDDPGVQVVLGDLGDPRMVDHAVDGARIVYHVGAAMKGSARDFDAGTRWGTKNVIDACVKHGTQRLVYVSSLSVMDHAGRDPAMKLVENSAFEPFPERRGAYTQTKLVAENMVRDAIANRNLSAVIIRPGQIFGPGAERVTPNGTIALAGRWVAVGEGTQTIPVVYVDDVVDALLLAAEAPAATGGTFNVVDPEVLTQQQYLDRVQKKLGSELKVLRVPVGVFMGLGYGVETLGKLLKRDVPLTRYRVRSLRPLANFDLTAARERLGWTPKIGVRDGLDRTFGAA